jgi:hypothetical protein
MYEMAVNGEIKALAFKEGSSGIFSGTLEGLYQGYRFGSITPDVQSHVLKVNDGMLALVLKQEIRSPLTPRPSEHPFSRGKDPFAPLPATGASDAGPSAAMPITRQPRQTSAERPLEREAPTNAQGTPVVPPSRGQARGPFWEIKLSVDPATSTGIFSGATGEMEITAPNYRIGGYLVIETKDGNLQLNFLEAGEQAVLKADLWVNGEASTGKYRNARGELKFALTRRPPNFGRGPYQGTIWLEQKP